MKTPALLLLLLLGVAACEAPIPPVIEPLPPLNETGTDSEAAARINGAAGTTEAARAAQISYGQGPNVTLRSDRVGGPGNISLDFADTDIREVVAQILGTILKVNYTIDPAVRGTVTLRTTNPVSASQLLPVLQALLAQNNATLLQASGIYRVVPAAAGAASAGGAGNLASGDAVGGSVVVQLRFASAEDLAKVLQPFAGNSARVTADPGRNVLLIGGDPAARSALLNLVQAFDINILAGQSYALFPVTSGNAKDFAASLQAAFRTQGALAGVVRVVPMERMDAVLVISSQPRYIDDARRVFAIVERARRETVRSWHVYYLQNSQSNDVAYVLQQAFTPGNVTAQPTPTAQGSGSSRNASLGRGGNGSPYGGNSGGGGPAGGIGGSSGGLAGGGLGGGPPGLSAGQPGGPSGGPPPDNGGGQPGGSANPLLGGLDPSGGGATDPNSIRIIPNPQNNALVLYATPNEKDAIEKMLRKIDILPLQVRIDATIAEVTLNDTLQYGTQFFFKSGGINGILNNTPGALGINPAATVLGAAFPGFIISGTAAGGAPIAISALQAVTTVKVLSSPEIMVLDNHPARLQVGNLVPYLTTSSQSALSPNAPVINSVAYQPTGVILEVTPRVNSGGLVTIDIDQQVSDVDTTTPRASGIDSPTFLQRSITSRVVVQDGQTIGLAGLIRDNASRGNQGIPWLKDIPILGFFAGSQNNLRARTELLVLITPHVVHDQRDARALTEDLREQLINAAAVPDTLRNLPPSGSNDPNQRLRRRLDPR